MGFVFDFRTIFIGSGVDRARALRVLGWWLVCLEQRKHTAAFAV